MTVTITCTGTPVAFDINSIKITAAVLKGDGFSFVAEPDAILPSLGGDYTSVRKALKKLAIKDSVAMYRDAVGSHVAQANDADAVRKLARTIARSACKGKADRITHHRALTGKMSMQQVQVFIAAVSS